MRTFSNGTPESGLIKSIKNCVETSMAWNNLLVSITQIKTQPRCLSLTNLKKILHPFSFQCFQYFKTKISKKIVIVLTLNDGSNLGPTIQPTAKFEKLKFTTRI